MAAKIRRMLLGSNSKNPNIVQSNEIHLPINYPNWSIPEERVETIYKIGSLDFKTTFLTKTQEETISIQEEFQ